MKVLQNNYLFYGILSLIAIILSVCLYFLVPHGTYHTNYNDYMIYKISFNHLLEHKDMYLYYESEYNDLYKYSPSFAMLMAPFACLPNLPGLILWNLLNLILPFYAFRNFPFPGEKKMLFAMCFILIEALTSLVATQCNCIMAGLFIITYLCFENKKVLWATLFVTISVFIKPYGLVLFTLFLFYPGKIKAIMYAVMWFVIIFILPLIVISPSGLFMEYKSWLLLLKNDHDVSYGVSFMGLIHSWFGITQKNLFVVIGGIILMLPLLRFKAFAYQSFRNLFLASVLIWVIIFNHKAETPGFIIAICGIAIWYFTAQFSWLNFTLLLMAFLFTVMEPTDIFPKFVRDKFLTPYVICVVPCTLIWIKICWELLTRDFSLTQIVPVKN